MAPRLRAWLSSLADEHAWRECRPGASDDIHELKQQNIALGQGITDLRLQLDERDQALAAAHAAGRELAAQLNTTARR